MANSEIIYLLIIEESSSDAESLANELRDAGHSINLKHVAELESLEAALAKQLPDILICGSGANLPDAARVKVILEKQQSKAPVIAISDEASEDTVVTARKAGITALVSYDRPDHLHAVFRHEAENVWLGQKLKTLANSLQASEKRCHALIENSSDAIAYIHEGMHVYANKPYMDLFDVTSGNEIECIPVLDMICSSQQDTFRDFLKSHNDTGKTENTLNIDCISPDGEVFNSTMELSPATMEGESCTQIIIRVNSGNNSELEKKIRILSQKDMLTGLWNRQHFMRMLDERINTSNDQQHALAYLTLDNFKVIREEAGIASSDLVLCDIARLLDKQRGEHDILARFGDSVFTLLKLDTHLEELQAASKNMLLEIAGHLTEVEGRAFAMTASIGICEINRQAADAQTIISHADTACEVARTSGGNQVHTHSNAVDESISPDREHHSEQFIRETIDNERFYLVFQPIVSLKGDDSQHYEVLLRIIDTEGQVILPGQFLSIAERSGLATEIDRWIIDKAFSMLAEFRKENSASFFIKVSGPTLADPDTADWISQKTQEYRLVGDGIVFEIAEQHALKYLAETRSFMSAMQSIQCKIAVEHFGIVEHAQLLQHIHPDIIKIDGSLIGGLPGNKDIQSRVKSLIEATRENKSVCIAECVEDASMLALLWQYGVDYIQGYFIQEPDKKLGYEFDSEIV